MATPTQNLDAEGPRRTAIEAYVPGLRRYFSRRVPAREIDALVQEVFLRMQAHTSATPIEHMDRYLFTVARAC